MVTWQSEIERFEQKGEKTGWRYIFIPSATAEEIKPGTRTSFRVRGMIDAIEISGLALTPMGDGDFILALKADLRRQLKKDEGAAVTICLEEHKNFKMEMPEEMESCLLDEPALMETFMALTTGHRNYFLMWINAAKTPETRSKRIVMTVNAMANGWDYGQMIRAGRKTRD